MSMDEPQQWSRGFGSPHLLSGDIRAVMVDEDVPARPA